MVGRLGLIRYVCLYNNKKKELCIFFLGILHAIENNLSVEWPNVINIYILFYCNVMPTVTTYVILVCVYV